MAAMRPGEPAVLLAAALFLGGCVSSVSTEDFSVPPLRDGRIALLALAASPAASRADPDAASAGARILTARLLEQLDERQDLEVVSPASAARALETAGLAWPARDPAAVGALLARNFGVAGFLAGEVSRYRGRASSTRAASVEFEIGLYRVDGQRLWRAQFSETQQGLSDDPGSFGRAWERGFRWRTAEQLAAYGAREVVERVPGPEPGP
ncbi:MAG: hypothetical protein HRU00_12620 [Myxococcales bacterium]|nr:hypothetical protein [Myxococcales bacterium]